MSKIQIVEKPAAIGAEIRLRATMLTMPFVMGSSYRKIMKTLDIKNLKPNNPPYARYMDVDGEKAAKMSFFSALFFRWNLAVGIPVEKKFTDRSGIICYEIPAAKYVKVLYVGPYKGLGQAHKLTLQYIKDNGYTFKNESLEIYLNDPRTTPKQELKTEVLAKI